MVGFFLPLAWFIWTRTHKKHNVSLWNCVKVWKQWPATTWLLPSAQFLVTQWNSLTCSVPRLLSSVSLATALKAFSTPNVICPSACYGTAAVVVYTGLRKEPCEPGGNCVKSPCELLVRWLADRWVCRPGAGKGREEGRRIREKGRGKGGGSVERTQFWKQACRELAGSACTWGAVFHLAGRNTVCKGKGGGGGGDGGVWVLCLEVIGHFQLDLISINKGLFVNSLWLSLWTYSDLLS